MLISDEYFEGLLLLGARDICRCSDDQVVCVYVYFPKLYSSPESTINDIPDSKVHGANMGPTWVLSAPDEPHVGPMNLAIRDILHQNTIGLLY